MKFEKVKNENIMGGTQVIFTTEGIDADKDRFKVIANKQGIRLLGPSPVLETRKDLDDLARTIAAAWSEHLLLKPKLTTNLSGH